MSALERRTVHGNQNAIDAARLHKGIDQRIDEQAFPGCTRRTNRIAIHCIHIQCQHAVRRRRGLHCRPFGKRACRDQRIHQRLIRIVHRVCADRRQRFALLIRHIHNNRFPARWVGIFRLHRILSGVIRGLLIVRRVRRVRCIRLDCLAWLIGLTRCLLSGNISVNACSSNQRNNHNDCHHNRFCPFAHGIFSFLPPLLLIACGGFAVIIPH